MGGAIVRRLLHQGVSVRSVSRGEYPHLHSLGVECLRVNLDDRDAIRRATAGCDVVFHVAAKAGIWGAAEEYERTNIVGTENIIQACLEEGVGRLVYTSSPSVVYDGTDQEGIDETTPYPDRYLAHYPRTKAIAEQSVLSAANSQLATVALRPHLIWGPRDNHLVPRLVERSHNGQLRLLGKGEVLVDSVYVDNAADAHLLAAEKLTPTSKIQGQAYFITNHEPLPIGELLNRILAAAQAPPVTKQIPAALAYGVGACLETAYSLLGKQDEPRMTRFLARQLSTAHWFDQRRAREELGYTPRISITEGLERLARWFGEGAPSH